MEPSVTTRLGDGSLVRMTPQRDPARTSKTGTAAGAKRAKVRATRAQTSSTTCSRSSPRNASFTAVDVGDEVILTCDGSGNLDSGTRIDELYSYESHRGADIIELCHIDYSYKAIKTILSFETQAMKSAQLNLIGAAAVRRHARPGALLAARRSDANWSELMPLGASTRRARPRRRPSTMPCATWSSSATA